MNEILNKFLLAGDKFMPDMHLRLNLHMVLVDHLQKTKNTEISRNTGLTIYLSKQTRLSLHGLWRF